MKPALRFPELMEMRQSLRVFIFGSLLLGLASCRTSPTQPPTQPASQPPLAEPAIPAGAREYRVVAAESQLQMLVYRGGTMARMGHNHVITSHHLDGTVQVTDDALSTRFDISFPVSELTVDEPAMREQAGPDFPPGVPQSARDGTRTNMLSESLLDVAHFPSIRLRALEVIPTGAESYEVGVAISIKDQTRQVRVPLQVHREEGALSASGEFLLKQTDLGLTPFSVMLGALTVVDEMRIRFNIMARAP